VRAVYAVYLLVTVPLLAFVLGELLWSLPHLLLTAAGTGLRQAQQIRVAWQHAAPATLIVTLVQLLLLGLPVAGLGLMLGNLGRRLGSVLWRFSRPTPLRRCSGGLVVVVVVAVLARLWLPTLRTGVPAPPLTASAARLAAGVPGVPDPFAVPVQPLPDAAAVAGPPRPRAAVAAGGRGSGIAGAWQAMPADGGPPGAAVVIAGSPARSITLQPDGSYCVQPLSGAPRCGRYQIVGGSATDAETGPQLTTAGRTLTVLGADGTLLRLQPSSATDVP
jgi:hypothetical protein